MLKTLRITSLIAAVLAACGVVLIVVMGLRPDAEIAALLKTPGVAEKYKSQAEGANDDKKAASPFMTQAKAFALRIDPPPPPPPKEPPQPKEPPKKPEVAQVEQPKPTTPPRPKGPVNAKFTLLATVCSQSDPGKSLALLQTSPTKQEWFWQGQAVGHLDIEEIRDGSVIFSQNGRNQQELFVPVKTEAKSILRADNNRTSSTRPTGPGSINVFLNPSQEGEAIAGAEGVAETTATTTESGTIRLTRPQIPTRSNVSSSNPRVRALPKPPTPEEQKATITTNVSKIQEIMSDEDTIGLSEEEKAAQKESWMKLIELLQAEKEMIDKNQQQPAPGEGPAPQGEAGREEAPKKDLTRQRPEAPPEGEK